MTRKDFLLSIAASMIAAILYKLARNGWLYLQSRRFTTALERFVRNASDLEDRYIHALTRPMAIAYASISTVIIAIVLTLAPTSFAPGGEIVSQKAMTPTDAGVEGMRYYPGSNGVPGGTVSVSVAYIRPLR